MDGAPILDPTGLLGQVAPQGPRPHRKRSGRSSPTKDAPGREGGGEIGEEGPDSQGLLWTARPSPRTAGRSGAIRSATGGSQVAGRSPAPGATSFPAEILPAAQWQVGQQTAPTTPFCPRSRLLACLAFARTKDRPCRDGDSGAETKNLGRGSAARWAPCSAARKSLNQTHV